MPHRRVLFHRHVVAEKRQPLRHDHRTLAGLRQLHAPGDSLITHHAPLDGCLCLFNNEAPLRPTALRPVTRMNRLTDQP